MIDLCQGTSNELNAFNANYEWAVFECAVDKDSSFDIDESWCQAIKMSGISQQMERQVIFVTALVVKLYLALGLNIKWAVTCCAAIRHWEKQPGKKHRHRISTNNPVLRTWRDFFLKPTVRENYLLPSILFILYTQFLLSHMFLEIPTANVAGFSHLENRSHWKPRKKYLD